MKIFIITGASGFVGNNLIREIDSRYEKDSAVRAIVLPKADISSLAGLPCQIFEGDVTRPETLEAAFDLSPTAEDQVYVIHCAGIIDISAKENPLLHAINVEGTQNIIDATINLEKRSGQRPTFIYVSSVHALPEKPHGQQMSEISNFDPDAVVGQYAKSKAAATQIVFDTMRSGAVSGSVVFPSGIIGPFDFSPENMKRLIEEVARGKMRICVKGGYDFVDVRDVAHGILQACELGHNAEGYLLTNQTFPIKEICDDVCAFTGLPPIKIVLPIALAKSFAPLSERYYRLRHEVPLFTAYALHTLEANSNFSHEKASHELGYTTRPLQETIFDMLAWMETSA